MADNGRLPAVFSRNNSRGAPALALVVTGLLASGMVLMSYSKSLVDSFTFLTKVVTAANLPLYLCCALALAVLWRRAKRTLVGDVLGISLIGTVYVVFCFVGLGREPFELALVLGAAGLPLYVVMRWRQSRAAVGARG